VLLPAAAGANAPPLMLCAGGKTTDDAVTRAARERAAAREAAERKRLLYVALTRAEDWLILCGAGQERNKPGSWYEALEAGIHALGGAPVPGPETLGAPVLRFERDPVPVAGAPVDEVEPAPAVPPSQPGWLGPAPGEERPPRPSPSALWEHGEAGGAGLGRDLALRRGAAVHRLLEVLPDRPAADRPALAARLLSLEFPELDEATAGGAVAEAMAVLAAPFAVEIFGPGSLAEAGIALDLPAVAPQRMLGRIDRLVIGADRVLVVDFKTDAQVPGTAAEAPGAYLAQLGAYAAALAQVWPDRRIEAAILWTRAPRLMPVDLALLDRALAATPARGP
jgi:ATP-dependent helicase/nuclease subunit A